MTARIPPGRLKELGPVNWVLWRVISLGVRAPDAHLFSTMGRTRGLFRAWLRYSSKLMPGGRIPRRETEMIILRVAHLRECQYEMDHHVRIGRRAGVTETLLEQVLEGPEAVGWDARTRAILTGVDQLVTAKNLDDSTWSTLTTYFDDRQMIEFCVLVTQYDALATTIGTLRIERDFTDGR